MAALKTVALHEAAHAVVARVLGQPVKLASLDSVLTRHRRGDSKAHRQQAIVALAGPAAEDRLCRHTREERAQLWATVWRIDLANAVGHVDATGGGANLVA